MDVVIPLGTIVIKIIRIGLQLSYIRDDVVHQDNLDCTGPGPTLANDLRMTSVPKASPSLVAI